MFRYNQTKYHWPLVAERSAQSTHDYRRAGNEVRACTPPEFLHSTNNCCDITRSPRRRGQAATAARPSVLAVLTSGQPSFGAGKTKGSACLLLRLRLASLVGLTYESETNLLVI